MKKFFAVLTAVVCLTLCALGLVACNTDEDEFVEVKEITLDITEMTLTEGEYYTLTATTRAIRQWNGQRLMMALQRWIVAM